MWDNPEFQGSRPADALHVRASIEEQTHRGRAPGARGDVERGAARMLVLESRQLLVQVCDGAAVEQARELLHVTARRGGTDRAARFKGVSRLKEPFGETDAAVGDVCERVGSL